MTSQASNRKMKRKRGRFFGLLLSFSLLTTMAGAKDWVLQNAVLKLSFNDATGVLAVLDKRIGKRWESYGTSDGLQLQGVSLRGQSLYLRFSGQTSFTATVTLTNGAEFEVTLAAPEHLPMSEISFPAAFKSPTDHSLLLTDSEGMLLPVGNKDYPLGGGITYFCGGGLSMSWMGVTDKNLSSGYMAILETPYDAAMRTERYAEGISFKPVWLASKEAFGYSRKMRYVFFHKGGYVAQAKRYRSYIWPQLGVKTLRQSEVERPTIKKMIGGVHIYVWDDARTGAFAKELKDSGISKAMFLWIPNHLPYPQRGYDDSLRALGYVYASYELYTDIHLRDTVWYNLAKQPNFLKRNQHPGLYNYLVARKKDGTIYSNQFGHYVCPKAVAPQIRKRTALEKTLYNTDSYFVDVYGANGLYECYNSEHPCTRQQWAEAIRENQQYLGDSCQTFLGAEWGADFATQQVVYNHGMMTLQRTWWGPEIRKKGTIYYYGDWRNHTRPTQAIGTRTAPPNYLKYSINETLRVPLYDLVYHDAMVSSWRWEDGNHHMPEIWWKKDLFNILYGNAPLWNIDREHWEAAKNTFIESYKKIHPWLQQIAYDELVSHRFLSADRKVQESTFSSGKKVVVNFGDTPVMVDGRTIEDRSFATFAASEKSVETNRGKAATAQAVKGKAVPEKKKGG